MEGKLTRPGKKGSLRLQSTAQCVESLGEGEKVDRTPSKGKDSTMSVHDMVTSISKVLENQAENYYKFLRERDKEKEQREVQRDKELLRVIRQAGYSVAVEIKDVGLAYTQGKLGTPSCV